MNKKVYSMLVLLIFACNCTFCNISNITKSEKVIITEQEVQNANFGNVPHDYKRIIIQSLSKWVFNPKTIILKDIQGPRKALYNPKLFKLNFSHIILRDYSNACRKINIPEGSTIFGYIIYFKHNSVGSHGNYVGFASHALFIYNNEVLIRFSDIDADNLWNNNMYETIIENK